MPPPKPQRKPKPGPKPPPSKKPGRKPGNKSSTKPGKQPDAKPEKLQKVLAAKGLGSRRAMEEWIAAGRVQVTGALAKLGARVAPADRIQVDQRILPSRTPRHQHLLYNKPEGEICSRQDPEGRPSVYDRLPKLKNQRWISVGRLDYGTSGLLLFTTDGALASRLMHPSAGIEREYAVRVRGQVSDAVLKRLRAGVPLEEGLCRFTDIQAASQPEGDAVNRWFYVVLMEGRNRAVRRLWESQGCTVSRLKRVRYGSFFIPSAVKAGRYQRLPPKDAAELYRMAGLTQ